MEPANVFDFQQEPRRVTRIVLVKSDLECERSPPGEEVDLERYRATVEPQRQHRQPALPKRFRRYRLEITSFRFIRSEGAVLTTFPAAVFQTQKLFDPRGDVIPREERGIFKEPQC